MVLLSPCVERLHTGKGSPAKGKGPCSPARCTRHCNNKHIVRTTDLDCDQLCRQAPESKHSTCRPCPAPSVMFLVPGSWPSGRQLQAVHYYSGAQALLCPPRHPWCAASHATSNHAERGACSARTCAFVCNEQSVLVLKGGPRSKETGPRDANACAVNCTSCCDHTELLRARSSWLAV